MSDHKEIKLTCLDQNNLDKYFKKLVKCYRLVFGGEDWQEWKICENNHKYSYQQSEHLKNCPKPKCSKQLNYYWPESVVEKKILTDLSLPESIFIIAVDGSEVIGFTWGYQMNDLTARKHLDGHLPYKLRRLMKRNGSTFWYQNEMGVLSDYRRQGLASQLYIKRMKKILEESDHSLFIIRSYPKAKTYHWYIKKIGYQILSKYYRPEIKEWRYLLKAGRQTIANYISLKYQHQKANV